MPQHSKPPDNCDARAATGGGVDLELIDEPTGAGQSFAESSAGREAVAHGGVDVGDAGALVLEDKAEALASVRTLRCLRDQLTAQPVLDDVARQLGGDRCEARLIERAEAERGGERAHLAARRDDVLVALKRDDSALQTCPTLRRSLPLRRSRRCQTRCAAA